MRYPIAIGKPWHCIKKLIGQACHKWNILGLTTFDDLAYAMDVLWLLQRLPATSHCNDVAELLQDRFAQQQGSHQFDPDDVLRMQALAEDMWYAWSQYLQRHDQSAFAHARSRARGLMRRHDTPRTHSRETARELIPRPSTKPTPLR